MEDSDDTCQLVFSTKNFVFRLSQIIKICIRLSNIIMVWNRLGYFGLCEVWLGYFCLDQVRLTLLRLDQLFNMFVQDRLGCLIKRHSFNFNCLRKQYFQDQVIELFKIESFFITSLHTSLRIAVFINLSLLNGSHFIVGSDQ